MSDSESFESPASPAVHFAPARVNFSSQKSFHSPFSICRIVDVQVSD
jgi:hypothetical protein